MAPPTIPKTPPVPPKSALHDSGPLKHAPALAPLSMPDPPRAKSTPAAALPAVKPLAVRYGQAVADVAARISKQGLGYPDSMDTLVLPLTLWEKGQAGQLVLKAGVKPSDAVRHFLDKSVHYKLDCALAQKMVQYSALMQAMGETKFNAAMARHGGMALGLFGAPGGGLDAVLKQVREQPDFDPNARPPEVAIGVRGWAESQAKPGDTIFFDFKGAPDALRRGGWGGENALALGGGQYYAHPVGIVTKQRLEQAFQDTLARYNASAGTNTKSELVFMQELGRLQTKLLE